MKQTAMISASVAIVIAACGTSNGPVGHGGSTSSGVGAASSSTTSATSSTTSASSSASTSSSTTSSSSSASSGGTGGGASTSSASSGGGVGGTGGSASASNSSSSTSSGTGGGTPGAPCAGGGALVWAQPIGSQFAQAASVAARGVAVQADGSIVVAGTIAGQVTFGTGTPYQATLNGGQLGTVLVARFASDGTFRSGRAYSSGSADGIAVRPLPDGSSMVAGQFKGQLILDDGLPTQQTLTATGGANDYDAFLAHVGADGNVIWAARAGGPAYDFPVALDVSADGSSALVGTFSGSITFNAGQASAITLSRPGNFQENYLARFDASGSATWARASGGTGNNDQPRGVAFLADGTVALSGEFHGNTSFEGQTPPLALTSAATSSLFLAHYQLDGTLAWVRTTTGFSTGFHVRQGVGDALVLTGAADGAAVFGAGEPTQSSLGSSGGDFVARYQEDGAFLGAGLLGTLLTENDMLVDPSGAVAVVGTLYNTGTFATAGMSTTITSLGWEDAYTACATPSGQVVWVSRAGGNQHDYAYGVARASNGDLVVVGRFTADMAVNPGQPGAVSLAVGMGFGNAFLARYSP